MIRPRRTPALALASSIVAIALPAAAAATTAPPTTAPATTAPAATTAPPGDPTTAPTAAPPADPTAAPPADPTATTAPADPNATTAPADPNATTTAAPAPGGAPAPALAAGATVADLQSAVLAIIGPTDDAFGRFANLAPYSFPLPTPAGSFLADFRIQYFNESYSADFELQLGVPAADAVAMWQAAATEAGFVVDEDSTASNGDVSERELRFDHPANDDVRLTVTVTDRPDVDWARVSFGDAMPPETAEFTRTWASAVSMPAGGEFAYGTFRYDASYSSGAISVSYDFPGGDAAAMKQQVIATMPANGFTYDPEDDTDEDYLYLIGDESGAGFTRASLSFRQHDADASVSATADFTADTPPIPEAPAPDPTATTAAAPTTAPTGPAAPVSTEPPLYAPAVPAGATMPQIAEALNNIFGPTTDAPAELSTFIPVLSGIPTPPDAVVEAYDMTTSNLSSGTRATGRILFTTATPPAELLSMYANAAAALGMVETANATSTEDGEVTTAVAYEVPDADIGTGFDVHVVDGEEDHVQLTIYTPSPEPIGAEINDAVVTALGLPAGEVEPQLSISLAWFSNDANIRTYVDYPGDEATVRATVDAAILATGATLDAEMSSDSYQYYELADGADVQVSYRDDEAGTVTVSLGYSVPLG